MKDHFRRFFQLFSAALALAVFQEMAHGQGYAPFDVCAETNADKIAYHMLHWEDSNQDDTSDGTSSYSSTIATFRFSTACDDSNPATPVLCGQIVSYKTQYVYGTNTIESDGNSGEIFTLPDITKYGCGIYYNFNGYDSDEVTIMMRYLNGEDVSEYYGPNTDLQVQESRSSTSYSIKFILTRNNDSGNFVSRQTWSHRMSLDGAFNPQEVRDSADHGRNCKTCGPGMPYWYVTEPYLNLWVKDTPVSYMTSLGQTVSFELASKQRDTRPRDTGVPVTGWGHNWFSYLRYATPRLFIGVDQSNTNTDISGTSARGVPIRSNWILTNDVTKWSSIVYAPDTSEYNFDYSSEMDSDSGFKLIGGTGGVLRIVDTNNFSGWQEVATGGLRLVHPDGSQDYYVFFTNYSQPVWGPLDIGGRKQFRFERPKQLREILPGSYSQDWSTNDPSQSEYETLSGEPIEYMLGDALLTDRVDPFGNTIRLVYAKDGTNYYLSKLIDYDGRETTLSYNNGLLSRVDMPYGKSALMHYNSDGLLDQITDAVGMSSSIEYTSGGTNMFESQTNYYVSSLATPYGETTFVHTEAPFFASHRNSLLHLVPGTLTNGQEAVFTDIGQNVDVYVGRVGRPDCVTRSCTITHPDNSHELYLYRFDSETRLGKHTFAPGDLPDDGWGDSINAWLSSRNSFHWNRRQCQLISITNVEALTTGEMLLSTQTHWLAEPVNFDGFATLSESPSSMRGPSPDGSQAGQFTWMEYSGQSGWQISPSAANSSQSTHWVVPGGPVATITYDYNSSGRLSSMQESYTAPGGAASTRSYDYTYHDVTVNWGTDQWTYSLLSSVNTPSGTWTVGDPQVLSTANGGTLKQTITDPLGNATQKFYNRRMQLTGVIRPNGSSETNLYGPGGFLMKRIEPEAQATNAFTFANGLVSSRTTPLGLTLNYSWDKLDRLTQVNFPDGTTVSNQYFLLDIVGHKDRLNQWTRAQYDNMRQLLSTTDARNNTNRYSWCSCGSLGQVTDPLGNTTTYTRDYAGRVTRVDYSGGSWVTYTPDVLGRVTHVSSSDGLSLDYTYNIQGLVTRVSNPAGNLFQAEYDASDRMTYMTNAMGAEVTSEFDGLDRVLSRRDAAGGLEQFTYNTNGLIQYQDAMSRITSYGYDPAGRLASITNANNEVTDFGYNAAGEMTSLIDGRGNIKRWAYDIYGRQIAETNANNVLVRTNGYDANGRMTSQWTAAKGLVQFSYDANGNVTSVIRPLSGTITYQYDKLNRLTNMTDSAGATALAYANFGAFEGALASENGPWNNDTVNYTYTGRKLTSIGLNGWTESIGYDSSVRPNVFTSSAGTFTYTFNGAGTRLNTLALPGSSTVSYGYNARGDLNLIALARSGATLDSHGYERDASGMITKVTRVGGVTVDYGYDPAGQLASAIGREADTTLRANENFGYAYDASGNLNHRTNNTLEQTFTSDNANQLNQITRNNTLTVAGNLTSHPDSLTINSQSASIYSDLTYATPGGVTISNGTNTFTMAVTQGTTTSNQSTMMVLPATVNCAYDLNGNLTSDGQKGYAYDDENQLIRIVSTNGWKSEFSYDGLGRRRVRKEYTWSWTLGNWQLTNEVHYVYDGMMVLQERDGNNNTLVTYTRGLDLGSAGASPALFGALAGQFQTAGGIGGLLARTDNSGSAYYHSDAGGNITAMVDGSGNVVARYLYDPYGNLLSKSGSLADANTYRFSSKEVHANSGLYYYGFRYYEPNLQRWLNQDPIGEAGGVNLYGFVGNSPTDGIDRYGFNVVALVDENGNKFWFGPPDQTPPGYYPVNTAGYTQINNQWWRLPQDGGLESDPLGDLLLGGIGPALRGKIFCPNPKNLKPPCWKPNWTWKAAGTGKYSRTPRWFEPSGSQWRWHYADKYHPWPHWDYKSLNGPWVNIGEDGSQLIFSTFP